MPAYRVSILYLKFAASLLFGHSDQDKHSQPSSIRLQVGLREFWSTTEITRIDFCIYFGYRTRCICFSSFSVPDRLPLKRTALKNVLKFPFIKYSGENRKKWDTDWYCAASLSRKVIFTTIFNDE